MTDEKITLYQYIKEHLADYDVYDDTYDVGPVTICWDEDMDTSDDPYDMFITELMKKVTLKQTHGNSCILTASWTDMILKNKKLLRDFTLEYWCVMYEDEDDFVCEWISELRAYVSGYVSDDFYPTLFKLATDLRVCS